MTLDLPSTLVIVGVGGYVTFRSFSMFQNTQYNAVNGEKLVLRCLTHGCINFSLFTLFLYVLNLTTILNFKQLIEGPDLWKVSVATLLYLLLSFFLGFIYSFAYPTAVKENKLLFGCLINKNPDHSNFLEEILIRLSSRVDSDSFTLQNNNNMTLVELDTGKLYMGLIQWLDLNDHMPIQDRFVSIVPLMSGLRTIDSKEKKEHVKLETNYLNTAINTLSEDKIANTQPELLVDIAIRNINHVVFPQSKIVTVRQFDMNQAQQFGLVDTKND